MGNISTFTLIFKCTWTDTYDHYTVVRSCNAASIRTVYLWNCAPFKHTF